MLTHSGQKPFACIECNNTFTIAGNLKQHMMLHSGVKPFRCEQCDYSCAQAQHLKEHILRHSGEKLLKTHSQERPNKCNLCENASSRVGSLKRHLKSHSREKSHLGNRSNAFLSLTDSALFTEQEKAEDASEVGSKVDSKEVDARQTHGVVGSLKLKSAEMEVTEDDLSMSLLALIRLKWRKVQR